MNKRKIMTDKERQARYSERMSEKGYRQRKWWLLDEEYDALQQRLEEIRGQSQEKSK